MPWTPPANLTDWAPGTSTGVPGGSARYRPGGADARTALIDVTQSPYFADSTGATDSEPAIKSAITAATSGQVVYLPAGTYRINDGLEIKKNNISLRGAGVGVTTLDYRGTSLAAIVVGADTDWPYATTGTALTVSAAKGATVLEVASTSGFTVGQIVRVAIDNDPALPVVQVNSVGGRHRHQNTQVTAKTDTTITIDPPLHYAMDISLSPQVKGITTNWSLVGIEEMTINASTATATPNGVWFNQARACWAHNVRVVGVKNYPFFMELTLRCSITKCFGDGLQNTGPNGAGLLVQRSTNCLFEDNIFRSQFPHIEVNFASSGNAFLYNLCVENAVDGLLGGSLNTNHGPHNSLNLYEGNVAAKLQSDGYFGSSSDDTVFRNWLHASDPVTDQFWSAVSLNRFTRNYNIIGNVLGRTGHTYTYENDTGSELYSEKFIYALGFPNIGNLGSTGTAQPSEGDLWAHWGTAGGVSGFQEWDLDVAHTTNRKHNWNASNGAIPVSEELDEGETLPDSLAYSAQPDWWPTSLAWPPVDPTSPNEDYEMIPAGYRFLNGGEDPPDAPTTTTPNPLAFRSNAMLAMGAF